MLDNFGGLESAWRETNAQDTALQAVIDDLLEGQYSNPVRMIGFNTTVGWSRDVSEEVARELGQRCADHDRELPGFLREFVYRWQTAKGSSNSPGAGFSLIAQSSDGAPTTSPDERPLHAAQVRAVFLLRSALTS